MDLLNKYLDKLFLIPGILMVVFVALGPIIYLFYISAFDYSLFEGTFQFVGLRNYTQILSDPKFWTYLQHTLVYVIGVTIATTLLALIAAWSLSSISRMRLLMLLIVLIPMMLPKATAAVLFRWMFHDLYGVATYLGSLAGVIGKGFSWLTKTIPAYIVIILTDTWSSVPFAFILLFAGFQRIPKQLKNAAKIDGASKLQTLRYLLLPIIKPEILIVLVTLTMFTFRRLTIVWLITKGGPGTSTEVLATFVTRSVRLNMEYGKAGAISVIMALITVIYIGSFWLYRSLRNLKGES